MFSPGTSGEVIARANAAGRAALVGYLPLGFPDLATTRRAAAALATRVDLLLLGHPTSDPSLDTRRVSRALARACAQGLGLEALTDVVEEIAPSVPTLVVAYWHELARLGATNACRELAHAGCVGVMTPDLAPEHGERWLAATDRHGLDRILTARASYDDDALARVAAHSRGFVYVPARGADTDAAGGAATARRLRALAPQALLALDVAEGTAAAAHDAGELADAVLAGTALVETLPDHGRSPLTALGECVADLATGLDR